MTIDITLDDALIEAARAAGNHPTKKAAVTAALEEYIRHRQQLTILDLFHTIDFDPDYNSKQARQLDQHGFEA